MERISPEKLEILHGGAENDLVLYPIQDSDTDNIVRWRNQDFIKSHFIFRFPFTAELHNDWIKNRVNKGDVIQYIIADSKIPIGSIYIRDIDLENEVGEFGIFIGEKRYLNKGIGLASIKIFMPYIFSFGFHRIFLRVFAENEAARRCYKKAGFIEEGIAHDMIHIDGRYRDIVFMAILNEK